VRRSAKRRLTPLPSNSSDAGSGVGDGGTSLNSRRKSSVPFALPPGSVLIAAAEIRKS
jgi:hypothetical protein